MGRKAHVLRMAFGRNADQAPDWTSLRDHYAMIEPENSQAQRMYRGVDDTNQSTLDQCFNDKGQPTDRRAREVDRARCEAQNAVVSIALLAADGPDNRTDRQPPRAMTEKLDCLSVNQVASAIDGLLVAWLASFRGRLSMLRSLSQAVSLSEAFELELRTIGAFDLFTTGYLCAWADFLSMDSSVRERFVALATVKMPVVQHSETATRVVSSFISLSCLVVQGAFLTAAHLHALHIGPDPTRTDLFPWVRILRSCNTQQLLKGVTYVLLPAWLLCNLQLQAKTSAQSFFHDELGVLGHNRYLSKFEWTASSLNMPRLLEEQVSNESPDPRVRSLRRLLLRTKSTIRCTSQKLLHSLGWNTWQFGNIPSDNFHHLELISRLPAGYASNVLPELCWQILTFPINGFVSRSLAWLFLQPGSPFEGGNGVISRDDLYPISPTLADFTPGLGLTRTLSCMAKVGLTFALQCAVSMALVGIKSAFVLTLLKTRVDELVSRNESQHSGDGCSVD